MSDYSRRNEAIFFRNLTSKIKYPGNKTRDGAESCKGHYVLGGGGRVSDLSNAGAGGETHPRGRGPDSRRHQTGDADVPVGRQAASLLLVEVEDSQDVGGHHDQHRDVEGEERSYHQEVDIVELAPVWGGHVVVDVEDGEDGDGAGQERAESPGEADLVEDVVLGLSSVVERPPDAAVPPDRDEHEVEDGDGAGQHVTGLVEDAPEGRHGPGAWHGRVTPGSPSHHLPMMKVAAPKGITTVQTRRSASASERRK